jgi:hypothetical protein
MQSAYPAGRDIYLSALVFILRQMVRFWQTGLPEIAAFDRPRARLFAGQPGVCERPVRHAKPGRAGPIAQPRFDDDGDPAIADRPSRLHRACTFVLLPPPPPWPPLSRSGRGAPAAAPVVQRLPLLSSFARLASPLSLSRQLATIPGIITPRECLALLSCLGPPPAASL